MMLRLVNDLVCLEVGKAFIVLFQLTVVAVVVTNPIAGHTVITDAQTGLYLIGASICLLVGIVLIAYSKKLKNGEENERKPSIPMDITVKKGIFHILSSKEKD